MNFDNSSSTFDGSIWTRADECAGLSEAPAPRPVPIALRRRRGFAAKAHDPRSSIALVDDDGILRWIYEPPAGPGYDGRRSYRAFGLPRGDVRHRFYFQDVGQNQITNALSELDLKLTPAQGLRQWRDGALKPVSQEKITGTVLLLVHGTFSNSDMFFTELQASEGGKALLKNLESRYAAILAFDHATLSVAAWLNALDLDSALRNIVGPLHMVCHSRGGLVASWLMRLGRVNVEKIVFVGSPLSGTSLASPERLRAALDFFANVANALAITSAAASLVVPLAAGAAGLAKILGRTLRLGSDLPIADAAVLLVPGLASQQLVGGNEEIKRLFLPEWRNVPEIAGIGVQFEPTESSESPWKFWHRFSHLSDQLKYAAADLVFDGANDLVVDFVSMSSLGEKQIVADNFCNLGKSPDTHHCNYFRNASVLEFLSKRLR
jgi:pimeloyl-ACP methyl ester carboxylesterase